MLPCGCHPDAHIFNNGYCPRNQEGTQTSYQHPDIRGGAQMSYQYQNVQYSNQISYQCRNITYDPGQSRTQVAHQKMSLLDELVADGEERINGSRPSAPGHNIPAASSGSLTDRPNQSNPQFSQRGVSGRYICNVCGSRLKHEKDLRRHIGTMHPASGAPAYRCGKLIESWISSEIGERLWHHCKRKPALGNARRKHSSLYHGDRAGRGEALFEAVTTTYLEPENARALIRPHAPHWSVALNPAQRNFGHRTKASIQQVGFCRYDILAIIGVMM
ncbi:hypothetical protein FHL15_011040 [Xylaria flabelliformis]|uniref:C2H2-type domain-containing protein n=1 Tax=Xylaria flabelliformis TaxID=2512241 RepID=A0A553HJF2_9PEZI|nr:hypothetical protein FHL15_011040 [Xylaria flabelliformis]